jgi:membrane protein required for beta-lactamase induction
MSVRLDPWNDPGWKPAKRRRTGNDRVLSVLKWTGMIILIMCLAPFVLMAQFLRTFVRINI